MTLLTHQSYVSGPEPYAQFCMYSTYYANAIVVGSVRITGSLRFRPHSDRGLTRLLPNAFVTSKCIIFWFKKIQYSFSRVAARVFSYPCYLYVGHGLAFLYQTRMKR
ncbi:hypothetical protein EDB89DRAFT_1029464 [Lactarius sanguifluus]|nr:hypothetical protein EDB89DRAFT_1029464 [Lactarius sanguifluus]